LAAIFLRADTEIKEQSLGFWLSFQADTRKRLALGFSFELRADARICKDSPLGFGFRSKPIPEK
jgi:hypothetical protein